MLVRQLVDRALAQHAYLIGCQRTGEAILIDPERDVAACSRAISSSSTISDVPTSWNPPSADGAFDARRDLAHAEQR
jgi:hypothetical protein